METFGLSVSFSLYGDILGTSDWAWREQELCQKRGLCGMTVDIKMDIMLTYDQVREDAIETQVKSGLLILAEKGAVEIGAESAQADDESLEEEVPATEAAKMEVEALNF